MADLLDVVLDTHCHLDLYPDPDRVLGEARANGVGILVATNRPSEYRRVAPGFRAKGALVGLGVHPELAGSVYLEHELAIFDQEVAAATLISEIGIDIDPGTAARMQYFGAFPTIELQRHLLERILRVVGGAVPLSVHSRGAQALVADILQDFGVETAVFHWFSGDLDVARRVADAGWSFSVNARMLDQPERLELLRWIPRDRLHLETDGPFVQWGETPIEPARCRDLIPRLARLRGVPAQQLEADLVSNAAVLMSRCSITPTQ